MEVNVDVLEQMDLMDISDQEALDVFLNSGSGADEGALASALPGAPLASICNNNNKEIILICFLMQIFTKAYNEMCQKTQNDEDL